MLKNNYFNFDKLVKHDRIAMHLKFLFQGIECDIIFIN